MVFVVMLYIAVAILVAIVVVKRRRARRATPVPTPQAQQAKAHEIPVQVSSPEVPALAPTPKQDALTPKLFRGWKWKRIAFMDVETTGLTGHDRVVTLAVLLLDVPEMKEGEATVTLSFAIIHRIYNPGQDCNPVASHIHGHSDWKLRHQPFFIEEAEEVSAFLGRADLVVCHNANFDMRFMDREFAKAGMPPITAECFCTMEGYRGRYPGSASLNNVIRQLGLKRESGKHGALEDAWLTMNVFFLLQGVQAGFPFSTLGEDQRKLENLRDVPPIPDGDLPPRKRRLRVKVKQATPSGVS
jgi:DNA polymerase-3 subunit epsilon